MIPFQNSVPLDVRLSLPYGDTIDGGDYEPLELLFSFGFNTLNNEGVYLVRIDASVNENEEQLWQSRAYFEWEFNDTIEVITFMAQFKRFVFDMINALETQWVDCGSLEPLLEEIRDAYDVHFPV